MDALALVCHPSIQILKYSKGKYFSGMYNTLGNNFQNILQSVVAFLTFLAYTNDTRFAWAYPPASATKSDVIPSASIKLATSLAAVAYLAAVFPTGQGSLLSYLYPGGSPMSDNFTIKTMWVTITLLMLTFGSMLGSMDPFLSKKQTKWDVAGDANWGIGYLVFIFFNLIGITVPLAFSKMFLPNYSAIWRYGISIGLAFILPTIFAILKGIYAC